MLKDLGFPSNFLKEAVVVLVAEGVEPMEVALKRWSFSLETPDIDQKKQWMFSVMHLNYSRKLYLEMKKVGMTKWTAY